jgi:hypothetical protein
MDTGIIHKILQALVTHSLVRTKLSQYHPVNVKAINSKPLLHKLFLVDIELIVRLGVFSYAVRQT